jgi:galactokinase
MSVDLAKAEAAFLQVYGKAPETIVRAPGRVNIIGEHTDYNHGFVLPMAIERETLILASRRSDGILNAYAANMDRHAQAALEQRARNTEDPWMDYVVGVADELSKLERPLSGADLFIVGDVPLGCGLSSSAALEMAAVCLFESLGGFKLEGAEAARLGQRVENLFLGLSTGIMDQFISRCGEADHGLFLDCRSYQYQLVPVAFPGAFFVIANTCCSRGLTKSKYNERVAECGEAVSAIRKTSGRQGAHLRDFTLADLDSGRAGMSETAFRRARHVITENARTLEACEAMRGGDCCRLGALMNASDASLREDYEVTSPELDAMTAIARALPGCFGARMTGAGFGGCTINLVAASNAERFGAALMAQYRAATGIAGELIISKPAAGAEILK